MKYGTVVSGSFVSRPNRFIAQVLINGREERVHVKNTGRCKELLVPGRTVYLSVPDNADRKTKYDLVAVEKPTAQGIQTVNIDSQAPNLTVEEWLPASGLFAPGADIRREVTHGGSRFDFRIIEPDRTSFLEVKGVTLEADGTAMFPDAPTERGVKHIRELIACAGEGFGAYILFVVQMKGVSRVIPNDATHREFGDVLRLATRFGVNILAVDCAVTADSMTVDRFIPVEPEYTK